MVVKIVTPDGRARYYECQRLIEGETVEQGEVPHKQLHLEANDEAGSVTVGFDKGSRCYVMNDAGRTIDRIYF